MSQPRHKPDRYVLQRAETLLREELHAGGENLDALLPHEISEHMLCSVHPSGALTYTWKGKPVLEVQPYEEDDGTVRWRFFTEDKEAIQVKQ